MTTLLHRATRSPLARPLLLLLPLAVWAFLSWMPRDPGYDLITDPAHKAALIGTRIVGEGKALSGDIVVVDRVPVRLWGMDAMERRQSCMHNGVRVEDCGLVPMQMLQDFFDRAPIDCTIESVDDWGRAVARCVVERVDMGGMLVHAGYALATPQGTPAYHTHQAAAESAKAGVWAGYFMQPWFARHTGQPD